MSLSDAKLSPTPDATVVPPHPDETLEPTDPLLRAGPDEGSDGRTNAPSKRRRSALPPTAAGSVAPVVNIISHAESLSRRAREAMAPTAPSIWHRVLRDPQLRELPYKIETNEHGQLVLSPHKPYHGHFQMRIGELLLQHLKRSGRRAVEFAVETSKGVKVPDVVWLSEERWAQLPEDAEASPVMPELCAEVRSEDNTDAEMNEKRQLYLDEGAQEVWVCDEEGRLRFFDADGGRERSALAPECPSRVSAAA